MNLFEFRFAGYELVGAPPGGFWRVSAHHEPFDPPPAPPPLGSNPADDDGHRFDDPEGDFRTL